MLYKYKCDICNNVYIGKTKRHLIVRQYEHLGKSIATGKPLRYSDKDVTTIRKHCHSLDHLASIDNFSVLGNVMNNYHLSLKVSLLILILKPSLNVAKESIPLICLIMTLNIVNCFLTEVRRCYFISKLINL